jgi:TusA-related sulfurtransferase
MRPMDTAMIDAHLENIDRRLTNLEQILPTLATKDELKALATKEELRLAIESLATKEELREEAERVRRHLTMLIEHQDDKIQILIEHVQSLRPRRSGE